MAACLAFVLGACRKDAPALRSEIRQKDSTTLVATTSVATTPVSQAPASPSEPTSWVDSLPSPYAWEKPDPIEGDGGVPKIHLVRSSYDDLPDGFEGAWLGLVSQSDSTTRIVPLIARRAGRGPQSCQMDMTDEQQKTDTSAIKVAWSGDSSAFLVFRHIAGAKIGPIETSRLVRTFDPDTSNRENSNRSFTGPDSLWLRFRGDTVRLIVQSSPNSSAFRVLVVSRLGTHTAFGTPNSDEGSWDYLWSGDLNHDGELDLFLMGSPKYGWQRYVLYLSGRSPVAGRLTAVDWVGEGGCT